MRVTFKYDPFGRRVYKSSSTATSVYAYDGDNLIEETNSTGTVVARYEQTQNIDEPLAMLRSSATSYFHADGLGSITSLSNSAGSIANTYTYDSFGKLTASTGSLVNPFQYTARESDPETGLYYYRARYYDANVGRFLNEDPVGFLVGSNFYTYVENSPLYFGDPSGLQEYPNNFVGPLPPTGYYTREITITPCGLIPPHPPSMNIDNNIKDARNHWNPFWFYNQVKTGGPWDPKTPNSKFPDFGNPKWDDFGNFNYGATGNGFGFSDGILLRGAGAAQTDRGPGDPGSLRHPLGIPPYGDEPGDQIQIQRGINYAKCKSNEKCGS